MTLLQRFTGRKRVILREREDFFMGILTSYYYEELTENQVAQALANPQSRESQALDRILSTYSRAKELIQSEHEVGLPPSFTKPETNDNGTSLSAYLKGAFQEKRVLIKPNVVSVQDYPETSSMDMLREIIYIVDYQTQDYAIGDGSSLFFDSTLALDRIRQEFPRLRVYDFNTCGYETVKISDGIDMDLVEVPSVIYDYDIIVNLSNLKSHTSFGFSGARKNMMGAVSPATRLVMHRLPEEQRQEALDKLVNLFCPQVTIVDARKVLANAQQIAYGGQPIEGPGVFFGDSPIELDQKIRKYVEE